MKTQVLGIVSALALSAGANAQITFSDSAVGSSTAFPTASISGINGTLSFTTVSSTSGGGSIPGGASQGVLSTAQNYGWGESFLWGGSANGNLLTAFSMIVNSAASGNQYTPFLFNIGSTAMNANGDTFNPSSYANLLDGSTITLSGLAAGPQSFLEFDFAGSDQVALTVGDNYVFGLLNDSNPEGNLYFERASGLQSDPNGGPVAFSGGFSATSAGIAGYGGGPRNEFVGLYTESVPEPTSLALLGLGMAGGAWMMRRRKS